MSTIKVDKIEKRSGSTLTLGGACTAVTLACGATQSGFGRTGTVDWCTTAKTSPFSGVSGKGYFVNTSGGAVTVTLPSSPSAGDIIALKDYAETWAVACKSVTLANNGSKINGVCSNTTLDTTAQSVTLIYVDGTKGWQDIHDSTSNIRGAAFLSASGGNATLTVGDFKTHIFTADGTFTVSSVGNPAGSDSVEYFVVAGSGASGRSQDMNAYASGGGGAGGFRLRSTAPGSNSPLNASSNVPVTATSFPIQVGAGGAQYSRGEDSIFSTITSAGGGQGGSRQPCGTSADRAPGNPGGSGGGGGSFNPGDTPGAGGTGNTPPVDPPQGNPGGTGASAFSNTVGGGGGGAGAAGANGAPVPEGAGGDGGIGSFIADPFIGPTAPSYGTPGPVSNVRYFAGGGGGGSGYPGGTGCGGSGGAGGGGAGGGPAPDPLGDAGTANTGGGSGGSRGNPTTNAIAGASGIVMIRYKFQ